jgi:phage terminase small subunit
MPRSSLTARQERFCAEYLIDLNATKASERAGYSLRTSRQMGSENLSKPSIKRRIEALMAERVLRTELTADAVIEALECVAFSDIGDFMDIDAHGAVQVKDIRGLAPRVRRALAGVRSRTERRSDNQGREVVTSTVEVRLWDKMAALRMLGQHYALFESEKEPEDRGDTEYTVTMVIPRANPAARTASKRS